MNNGSQMIRKTYLFQLFVLFSWGMVACNGRSAPTTPTIQPTIQLTPFVALSPIETAETHHPTPVVEVTNTAVSPTVTPYTPIQPYAGAPTCPNSLHSPHAWHGLWNDEFGCHYTHEHHANPHVLDTLFGTQFYNWAGGEISYPWQTFQGAGDHFEMPHEGSCLENECKHVGYKWMVLQNGSCDANDEYVTTGANHCIINARVQAHMIFSQQDALVRFHSVWVEAQVCEFGGINCGIYRGGGHLDMGRLNIPRGTYVPLPNDPAAFAELAAEKQPYRIHGAPGERPLDSWQSEGNQYNYLDGVPRLMVGFGVHVSDGWGGVDPAHPDVIDLVCPDFQCNHNNSEAAMFRVWVTIPPAFDGSQWDTDPRPGFFSYTGYTNRYGDIAENCTAVGLDCVPVEIIGVPIGRSRFRGELTTTNVEYDTSPYWPDGTRDWWIEYPN